MQHCSCTSAVWDLRLCDRMFVGTCGLVMQFNWLGLQTLSTCHIVNGSLKSFLRVMMSGKTVALSLVVAVCLERTRLR